MRVRPTATQEEVLEWLLLGVFTVNEQKVYSRSGKELTQRLNTRKGSERGDPRVDLYYEEKRKSINVSHLVWMNHTQQVIPLNFEIHHIDEDPLNNDFENLLCVHLRDHIKLHYQEEEEIPF